MTTLCRYISSPLGPLTLAGDEDGVTLTHLRMSLQAHPPRDRETWHCSAGVFSEAERQLCEYFDGQRTSFDVPVRLVGTRFQLDVWSALQRIPYGETRSYGSVATAVQRPGASRAVGLANGRNPVGIIVPCHRVIGANGSLTGYGGGLDRKEFLLRLERVPTN